MPTQESIKKIFFSVCRVAISVGALFLVIFMFRSKLHDVGRILLEARIINVIEAIAVFFAGFCVVTYRLKIIMAVQNLSISLKNVFSIGLIGIFFNNLLPSSIGGDAVKAYYAYKITGKKMESFSAVFVDRVLGLFTLIGLAMMALIFFRSQLDNPRVTDAIIAMTLASLLVLAFFASRRVAKRFTFMKFLVPSEKIREKLVNLYHSVYGYKQHPVAVGVGIFLSLVSQSLFIILNYFLALSVNASIPMWVFFVLIPVVATVSMAPSLNGLGVREGAYVYLFSHFCTSEQAFALSILNFFILITFSIAGGLVYLMRKLVIFKELESVNVIDELSHYDEEIKAESKVNNRG